MVRLGKHKPNDFANAAMTSGQNERGEVIRYLAEPPHFPPGPDHIEQALVYT